MRFISHLLVLLFFFSCFFRPSSVLAIDELLFSDDFSGDLSNWQLITGSVLDWKISEGELRARLFFTGTNSDLSPEKKYWPTNLIAYRAEFDFIAVEGADRNFAFGILGPYDWAQFHLVGNQVWFEQVENGQKVWAESVDYYLTTNVLHKVRLEVYANSAELVIDDQLVMRVDDADLTIPKGRFALRASTGLVWPTTVKYDNVKIWALAFDDTEPVVEEKEVELLKQNDLRWSVKEYDHARRWTNLPTINRWGCALTSLAMIMRYHDITHLPDGSRLLPDSLNEWLKSQPDGYVGEGLVNWAAASRLSREISQLYQTPKLEYRRVLSDPLAAAQNQLKQKLPVIFHIAEHFLVADQVIETNPPDFRIKDPFYNYQLFNQHQQPLLSIRQFMPSQTDLSYLILAAPPDVEIHLFDDTGQEITSDWLAFESLNGSGFGSQILEFPKPPAGEYRLQISTHSAKNKLIELFTYDQTGAVTDLSFEQPANTPATEKIIKIKRQPRLLDQLTKQISQSWQSGEFLHYHPVLQLRQILAWASQYPDELDRYLLLFRQRLEKEQIYLSVQAFSDLFDASAIIQTDAVAE